METIFSLVSKKQLRCTGFPLSYYEDGTTKAFLKASELLEMSDSSIDAILRKCSVLIELMLKKNHIFIVESLPINKKKTSLDKKNISEPFIQHMMLLQILVRELILKGRGYRPFWTEQSRDLSENLWLPTKIDLQDSALNSSSILSKKEAGGSKFWIKKNIDPQNRNLQTISLASSTSSIVDKWEKGDTVTKNLKLKIYPNKDQKKILKKWFGTCRYVYNRALEYTRHPYNSENMEAFFTPYHHLNYMQMRNIFVTKVGNEKYLNDWEFETPKDVRTGAIKELVTNLMTNLKKVKKSSIKKFQMKFKSKKKKTDSIVIPKTAINFESGNLKIYQKFLGKDNCDFKIGKRQLKKLSTLKVEADCKLYFNGNEYFVLVPIKKKVCSHDIEPKIVALDPGVRTFQTCFSKDTVIECHINQDKYNKLKNKISLLQKNRKNKNIKKLYQKIKNMVSDLHWRTITYLRKNFTDVLIPTFESKKMMSGTSFLSKKTKDLMLTLSHYCFRQRLIEKVHEYKGFRVYTVNEAYTSKTCTNCGNIYDIGTSKIYSCRECGIVIDRDINASRNIFLKYCCLT